MNKEQRLIFEKFIQNNSNEWKIWNQFWDDITKDLENLIENILKK